MQKQIRAVALTMLAGAAIAAAPAPAKAEESKASDPILGVWQNPAGTIEVKTQYCGRNLCGVVTEASPAAQADARRAGTDPLVGVHLLQNFVRVDTNAWSGTAFVPDMNVHVAAHISMIDADHLKISGCELGGLICKSQDWTKVR
ncbi:DUF2147 domain-containing protein [Aurantiacibacter rhizosphaerae]|uniref:DUF2147 domain-containing protein n=1 Tax=Aurantiacibacter rhizosphaerae TaxID=2691582 RepID=A0A844XHR1_9SPHN|nr:DUF2147 domain-containing protein [Aurantiacibacter rhizosphaerae]MWV29242.1 DUF2147 domain-containing protein [Aurantiacibacter rhizosphaerae]